MLFFSKKLCDFHEAYESLFVGATDMEEDENEEEQSNVSKDRESNNSSQGTAFYTYISLVKEVSDMTKEPWSKCWEMNIYEFFTTLSFSREYQRNQAEQQKKIQKQWN